MFCFFSDRDLAGLSYTGNMLVPFWAVLSTEWQQHLPWIGGSRDRLEGAERLGSSIAYKSYCCAFCICRGKIPNPSSGDGHGPHFIGNREGLFSAAKMLHNDLWIGTKD